MFKVYWTDHSDNKSHGEDVSSLSDALKLCEILRNGGHKFVTMVSENPNHVGKSGAAGVVDGKLPTGETYSWTKNDRVGAAFKSPAPVGTDNIVVDLDDNL